MSILLLIVSGRIGILPAAPVARIREPSALLGGPRSKRM
jgi:hypothetical protein